MNDDTIRIHRETVKIEGGRNLYNYTFEVEGESGNVGGEGEKPEGKLETDMPEAKTE